MAVLKNQRIRGSVTFWAWMASIAVHLIVLTVFGVIRFSQSPPRGVHRPLPMAKVSQVKKFIQAAPIIPKPKIEKPLNDRSVGRASGTLPANQIFDTAKPSSRNWPSLAPSASQRLFFSANSGILPRGIEFFGSWTDQRKVCYLVDCSGSMRGILGSVQKKLKESIQNLQPDQYFYIIFFGGDALFEFGNGRLVRATQKAKSDACNFVGSIRPAGRTNALAAMERALQISDSSGVSPSVVYFLTDGFELTTEGTHRLSRKIANLLKRFAPTTKINTIGFWPQRDDRKMLKTIAEQSGGESIFITDSDI